MDKELLKKYVEKNKRLVSMKETKKDNVFVLKYTKKVFYDNLWNDYLEECRGTLVDKDFNVISRPFTKIYNYGIERKAPQLDPNTEVVAYRKVNGFMVAMTYHEDDILISTTGTIDSDYVEMAKEVMQITAPLEKWKDQLSVYPNKTFMFECVHENDPHIVTEDVGMYFIGFRDKTWDSVVDGYSNPELWSDLFYPLCNKRVEFIRTKLGDLVKLSKNVKHEGFVFYTKDGISSKIKSPYYLVSKFLARTKNTNKLLKKTIKKELDEEYYPLIDKIHSDIEGFTSLNEQERLEYIRKELYNV